MKKDILSIICLTLVCATVMLGIMSIYKFLSPLGESRKIGHVGLAFETHGIGEDTLI